MNISEYLFKRNTTPTCFVCNKDVDKMDAFYNAFNGKHVFIAYCHGEAQEIEMDPDFITYNKLEKGYAFYPQANIDALCESQKLLEQLK